MLQWICMTGLVSDIQRYSTHDGPGIRTTVFLKGCPLACAWCQNPEGQSFRPELMHAPGRCIACDSCLAPSLGGVMRRNGSGALEVDREKEVPPEAASVCPSLALRVVGRAVSVGAVMAEVVKDEAFFAKSGGGLTISGGEPLAQADFTHALARAALGRGISVAIDTCLAASPKAVDRLSALPVLWLADLKHADPSAFAEGTGGSLAPITANLKLLATRGAEVVLRVPVVPGFNDDDESMMAILTMAAALAMKSRRLDLLPYHDLAAGKYLALGRNYAMRPGLAVSADRLVRFAQMGAALGLSVSTGA
jgi:pyruvate formate lyase activating enzyme